MNALTIRLKWINLDWLRLVMLILAVAGLGVSAYLMWGYSTPGAVLACGESTGCETVKNSDYANLAGIPLPVLGLGSYFTLLLLLLLQGYSAVNREGWSPYLALATFGISLAGVLYFAYLTYVEFFVIYAVCRWCVAAAIIMAAIFLLSILNLRNNLNPTER
jgi:uncharacterized membrane protein